MWYEVAQGADTRGPLAGVPYDGKLRKADGKGQWWEGLDPQDLYAQNHTPGKPSDTSRVWDWPTGVGASVPDVAYCERFYNRTVDLINKYHPDLLYFDDDALPLYPISDAGLRVAAHFYNGNMKLHDGRLEAVLNGKGLQGPQRKAMVWDIERGQSSTIEPEPWQTDTCIGDWHYDRKIFERHGYKTAATVVRTLADIVSKNGNLLLSVPVRGDGTLDSDEIAVVEGIAHWMEINRESIFGTRPWKVFGEGPARRVRRCARRASTKGKARPSPPPMCALRPAGTISTSSNSACPPWRCASDRSARLPGCSTAPSNPSLCSAAARSSNGDRAPTGSQFRRRAPRPRPRRWFTR